MVVTVRSAASPSVTWHDFTALPSRWTMQTPQMPTPQPLAGTGWRDTLVVTLRADGFLDLAMPKRARAELDQIPERFGDTSLLIVTPEEGRSCAKALGPHWMMLLRRHGVNVAGRTLTELVFRIIYSYRNAELQLAMQQGGLTPSPLTKGEAKKAWDRNLEPRPQARAWEYWSTRLKKAGEYPAGAPKASARPASMRGGKRSAGRKKR